MGNRATEDNTRQNLNWLREDFEALQAEVKELRERVEALEL